MASSPTRTTRRCSRATPSSQKLGQADADGIIQMYGTGGGNASSGLHGPEGILDRTSQDGVNTTIMGATRTSAAQIARYFKEKGATYPSSVYSSKGAATIEDFAKILVEEATAEGVRAEVVFAQAMHETGWLKFGGLVTAEKCNFAGLGATGNSADGASTDYGRGYTYRGRSDGHPRAGAAPQGIRKHGAACQRLRRPAFQVRHQGVRSHGRLAQRQVGGSWQRLR
jgi:hypothetical protein